LAIYGEKPRENKAEGLCVTLAIYGEAKPGDHPYELPRGLMAAADQLDHLWRETSRKPG
jgi:hypothetical protein